jgi:hypothetical protein
MINKQVLLINNIKYQIKFIAPEDSRCAETLSEEAIDYIKDEVNNGELHGELAGSPGEDDDFYGQWIAIKL